MTLEEFFKDSRTLYIHCPKKLQAVVLCKKFHKLGKTWKDGSIYLDNYNYELFKNNTCYTNQGTYYSVENLSELDTVINFNNLKFEEFNKKHMKEFIKLIELDNAGILDEYVENKDNILLYLEEVSQ